ncbi:chromosome replication initiation inhibitor protein [Leifsonia sp. Root227]|uniref:LysR family transcriptional regulator ArgP n=1 Tax=Leifsonia sp. Root227 TaxID=1736496 RepID=UPI0006F4D6A6|nr:LysR family transcriptional regulator ArgP [Leifsonia sp. Root227]KRC49525.1 chromosome replication initiation inhibitor protein [Leifsonia sp. Root227]
MDASTDQLRTLAAVVDHGTFDRAASALHITPSAVSQRMRSLESQVGRVLVRRSKPIEPTEAGRVLLTLARQVALLESEAVDALGADETGPVPRIPLVVNADSLATWVLPAIAELGDIAFDIVLDDQEHTLDRLRDGTAMAAISSDREPVQGCTVTRLGAMRYRAAASPAFVARRLADGWTPEAMAEAPMLVFDRKDALQDRYLAAHAPGAHPPRHYVPASSEFVRAAELGLGWGMLPDLQTAAQLAAGDLVVLDDTDPVDVPLFWHQWSLQSSTLAAVASTLAAAAARALR